MYKCTFKFFLFLFTAVGVNFYDFFAREGGDVRCGWLQGGLRPSSALGRTARTPSPDAERYDPVSSPPIDVTHLLRSPPGVFLAGIGTRLWFMEVELSSFHLNFSRWISFFFNNTKKARDLLLIVLFANTTPWLTKYKCFTDVVASKYYFKFPTFNLFSKSMVTRQSLSIW